MQWSETAVVAKIKTYLPARDIESVIVTFCLDNFNSLHFELATLQRLQLVQNVAAHLLTVLASFYWLPVIHRINLKSLFMVIIVMFSSSHQNHEVFLSASPGRPQDKAEETGTESLWPLAQEQSASVLEPLRHSSIWNSLKNWSFPTGF